MRVGIGYDSHRFETGRRLVLGGVEIPSERGLAGHSDADAVLHAIIDALLGAVGLGDIGTYFPSTDEQWRDADSVQLLGSTVQRLAEQNYQIVNVDVSVICEWPRIGSHVQAMRERIAGAIGISPKHVSVKGKSNEGMGWVGRGEGVAALAVALVATIDG
jgi:2-C-methyl-D-erythritol 2,4-cyclodiphosphate synthase